jgi:hypothetical protein
VSVYPNGLGCQSDNLTISHIFSTVGQTGMTHLTARQIRGENFNLTRRSRNQEQNANTDDFRNAIKPA